MKLSVIIPAYNEEKLLNSTLQRVFNYLSQQQYQSEVIVVNDGSIDNTANIAKKWLPQVTLISHTFRQGKGAAVKTGMLNSTGNACLFMDADNSTDIAELELFMPYLSSGYDVIIGSRALKESKVLPQPWYRVWAGKFGNLLIRLLAVRGVKDTQCGFKLFSNKASELFKRQTLNGFGFDFEILFIALKKGYRILELPIRWENRLESTVKLKDYFKTLVELIKIRFNDLKRKYV